MERPVRDVVLVNAEGHGWQRQSKSQEGISFHKNYSMTRLTGGWCLLRECSARDGGDTNSLLCSSELTIIGCCFAVRKEYFHMLYKHSEKHWYGVQVLHLHSCSS